MLKSLIGGMLGALVYFSPVAAQAQIQQSDPQVLAQFSSSGQSANAVSPLELQQFVQAVKQLKRIEMETQEKLAQALKSEKLSPERFQAIGQQRTNPDATASPAITPAEQERFEKAVEKIQKIQQEAAPKENRAVTMQGLTIERFNQIGQMIDKDPALKQRLQSSL